VSSVVNLTSKPNTKSTQSSQAIYQQGKAGQNTQQFNLHPTTHAPEIEIEGTTMVGIVIGFSVTGIFLITAMILILRDECLRHARYAKNIKNDFKKLKALGKSDQLENLLNEFAELEAKRGQNAEADKERAELADIN
jgi:hypothetical protein